MSDRAKLTHELGVRRESRRTEGSELKLLHGMKIKLYKRRKLVEEAEIPTVGGGDIVVDAGRLHAAKLLCGVGTEFFRYVAIGEGTLTPAVGQTALGSEITSGGGERGLGTETTSAGTMQLVYKFDFTAHFGSIQESGVFSMPSAGTMLVRGTFGAKSVDSGDSLEVTHKVALT